MRREDRGLETVVVTGAGSGIGYAVACRLLKEGYSVAALDIDPGRLEQLPPHSRLMYMKVDLRDANAVREAVRSMSDNGIAPFGLVACAAVYRAVPFLEMDEAAWDEAFDVNVTGVLHAVQAVLPGMRERRKGSIVLFSSTLARTGAVNGAHYAATKGAVLGLMRSLALESAADGIRVNAVSPGLTDTPQPRGHLSESELAERAAANPAGRIGTPEEMAEAALFLLDEDNSFMTGQDLRLSGGALLF